LTEQRETSMDEENDIVVLVVESEEEAEAIAFLKALVEKWILGDCDD